MATIQLNWGSINAVRYGIPTSKLDPNKLNEAIETAKERLIAPKSYLWDGFDLPTVASTSVDTAMELAGMNFMVEQRPLYVPVNDGGLAKTKLMVNVNMDTEAILGCVTSCYRVTQNKESIGELALAIMDNSDYEVKIVAGGTMAEGAACWLVLKISSDELIMGETYDKHIVLVNSFNGSTGIMAIICDTRLECLNALFALTNDSHTKQVWNIRHTSSSEGRVEEVRKIFANFKQYQNNLDAYLNSLYRQTLTEDEVREFLLRVATGPKKLSDIDSERKLINVASKAQALQECYNAPDLVGYGHNKARLLQAVAMYGSHNMPLRKSAKAMETRISRLWRPSAEIANAMSLLAVA